MFLRACVLIRSETMPKAGNVVQLVVSERGNLQGKWSIKIYRYNGDDWRACEPLWQKEFDTSRDEAAA